MDLRAPFNLQVTTLPAVLEHDAAELLHEVVCRVHRLFVLDLAVFELHQGGHHGVVNLLTRYVGQFSFIFDFRVFYNTVLGISRSFEISHCRSFDFTVNGVELVVLLLGTGEHLVELGVLLLDELLEGRDAVLVHVFAHLCCLPRFG